jgi:hypothetical protein
MKEPTFDADGYPSDDTIEAIEKWPTEDFVNCLKFAEKAYQKQHYGVWKKQDGWIKIATGGWSGNESIVYALKTQVYWKFLFLAQTSGGAYYIKDPETYKDYDVNCDVIVESHKKIPTGLYIPNKD